MSERELINRIKDLERRMQIQEDDLENTQKKLENTNNWDV